MLRVSAEYLNRPSPTAPALGQRAQFDRQLEAPIWADPLYLMMAALVSIRSGIIETLALSRTDLAFRLAEREIDRLKRFAPSQGGEGTQELLVHMAAYATLCNGLSADQALEAATQEGNALQLQYHGGYGALRKTLHGALPGKGNGIAPVVPDLIGEALVLSALGQETQQAAVVLRGAKQVGRVVPAFVVRAAQDFSDAGLIEPLEWLQALIEAGRADDIGLLLEIEGAMPEHTLVLREKAAEVSQLLVDRLSELGSQLPEEIFRSVLGCLTNNLAVRLGHLGRREEALEKAQQAVSIREQLAQACPDAFRPALAASLNNLANRLSDLGRREEALEKAQQAVSIREQLAQAHPDAFRPTLADSLNNLAVMLSELGRRQEALEKAQRAVSIYEQLAQANPDAFRPALAGSLNNLANTLRDLGRRQEALEKTQQAVSIYEQLAQAYPDAFRAALAMSLNTLAAMLSELGRRQEALEKTQQAVSIYEQLAQASPDAFLPYLAASLNNLANRLSALGRREEALEKAQQAVSIREQLAQASPNAFRPALAESLNNLAVMLSALGRRQEALEKAQQAVSIYEQLAQARPDAFLPNLARSISWSRRCLRALDRLSEAATAGETALRLLTPFFQQLPIVYAELMAAIFRGYVDDMAALDREPDEELLAPVIAIFEKLQQNETEE
jgi:tetratricopeptide (TPR) repeat protein